MASLFLVGGTCFLPGGYLFAAQERPAVIEDRGAAPASSVASPKEGEKAPAAAVSGKGSSSDVVYELLLQQEKLQQEIAQLRGQLEAQQHELKRMREEQRNRYLDLDQRLAELASREGSPRPAAPQPAGDAVSNPTPVSTAVSPAEDKAADKKLYDQARQLLLKRQFSQSIELLSRIPVEYPKSIYVPYAYYWLGESYLALTPRKLDKAEEAFQKVVADFNSHSKVPAALYKLGMIYHMKGDLPKARATLNRVKLQYPGSSEARLAESYLSQLK